MQNIELHKDLKNNIQHLKQLEREKAELQTRNEQLEEENRGFQVALKEILADLKKQDFVGKIFFSAVLEICVNIKSLLMLDILISTNLGRPLLLLTSIFCHLFFSF